MIEELHVHPVLLLVNADALAEIADRLGGDAAPPHRRQRRQPRIVEAVHDPGIDQLDELALAHHRMRQVEPRKLDLPRMVDAELVEEPVIERAMVLVLERAERVRDSLDGVLEPVRPIVHRVDAPRIAGAVVRGVQDAVHDRVAQVEVGRGHVNPGAERPRAVRELAGAHLRKEVQVLLDGAVAVRAVLARPGQRAAMGADLVGGQVADVGLALSDQLHGPFVHPLEVVRGEKQPVAPVGADPAHVLDDRFHELLLFPGRVRVVEPKVEPAAEILRDAVINPDRLRVADVQIGVRLRREARVDVVETPHAQVLLHRLADEIHRRCGRRAALVIF